MSVIEIFRQRSREAALRDRTATTCTLTNYRARDKIVRTFQVRCVAGELFRGLNEEGTCPTLGKTFGQPHFLPFYSLRVCCSMVWPAPRRPLLSPKNLDRRRARFWFRAVDSSRTSELTSSSTRKTKRSWSPTEGENFAARRSTHPAAHDPAIIGSVPLSGMTTRAHKSRSWCKRIGGSFISTPMAPV